jgi:deoxycytidylate deaminase
MQNMDRPLHLGLTGPFGSGCTIVTGILKERPFLFKDFSLSQLVKETWMQRNPGKSWEDAMRSQLQDMGNELRQQNNDSAYLAKKTQERASQNTTETDSLVFDSIRNEAEVEYLRMVYPDFYLIGVCCSEEGRWKRVEAEYERHKLGYANFKTDEQRDQNEEGMPFGQQVGLCMYEADVLITNESRPMIGKSAAVNALRGKLTEYVEMFGGKLRNPTEPESYMSIAHNASLMSECIKRQVGAVIVDQRGAVLGVAWNVNPRPLESCLKEFGECYRVMRIEEELSMLKNCPFCGQQLEELRYPYTCPNSTCRKDIYREYVRDRAMSKCTALHAEEMAILNSGRNTLDGCTIYTTTFPCFTCTQKILSAGIRRVVYVESYPDIDSIALFDKVRETYDLKLTKFEGVKARAYHRLFGSWRRRMEERTLSKRYQ